MCANFALEMQAVQADIIAAQAVQAMLIRAPVSPRQGSFFWYHRNDILSLALLLMHVMYQECG